MARKARKTKSAKVKKAEKMAKLEGLDRVIESYDYGDCIEVVGRTGGDTVTYRVYNDGRIYER